MGHNGHGINLYCVIMTLMCNIVYKSEDIHLNNFFRRKSAEEIILVNIEGEYIMLHSVCCATRTERVLEFIV